MLIIKLSKNKYYYYIFSKFYPFDIDFTNYISYKWYIFSDINIVVEMLYMVQVQISSILLL